MASLTRMLRPVRRVVERWWRLLGAYFRPIVSSEEGESRHRVGARARFWAELREGQREAEAHSEKRR